MYTITCTRRSYHSVWEQYRIPHSVSFMWLCLLQRHAKTEDNFPIKVYWQKLGVIGHGFLWFPNKNRLWTWTQLFAAPLLVSCLEGTKLLGTKGTPFRLSRRLLTILEKKFVQFVWHMIYFLHLLGNSSELDNFYLVFHMSSNWNKLTFNWLTKTRPLWPCQDFLSLAQAPPNA